GSLPWNGEGPPKVIVEFASGADEYRLTKVFSKKKEGKALLEKKVDDQWRTEEDAPKEASRRARELLRANKSTAGLNQLLWLGQGEIGLPEVSLDTSLQQKLSGILGVMVTGRDLGVRLELDRLCTAWFTATGRESRNSLLAQLEEQRRNCLERRDNEKQSFQKYAEALRQLQTLQDQLPQLDLAVKQARKEVDQLTIERESCQARLRAYQEAKNAFTIAEGAVEDASECLRKFGDALKRRQTARDEVVKVGRLVEEAEQRCIHCKRNHEEKVAHLASARRTEQDHQLGRDEIDDRRKLAALVAQIGQLQRNLDAAKKKEKEIAELEKAIQCVAAPDEKTLASLRTNRRQAAHLRAQLKAAEWQLSVAAKKDAVINLSLEGQPSQAVNLTPGKKVVWSLRQCGSIELPELGTVEVTRSHENLDLANIVRDVDRKDREYQDLVRSFKEDPGDESCLDRLTERRFEREAAEKRIKEVRAELFQLAPRGSDSFLAERDSLHSRQESLLQRHPHWRDCQPSSNDIGEMEEEFFALAKELKNKREELEANEKAAAKERAKAEEALHQVKEALASAKASEKSEDESVQRSGNEKDLQEKLTNAMKAQEECKEKLAASQLSEFELAIDDRLKQADCALSERTERLIALKEEISQLRGFLGDKEGLHTELADAEGALQHVESALARERLEADAHKRLRDLFDECRDDRVRQVMGPIAVRVVDWARKIGLDDCHEVQFGDAFLPEGLRLKNGTLEDPVPFATESYGTWEQLSIIVRLALGGVLAREEPEVAILDDPLAHTDAAKHRKILDILRLASDGNAAWTPPAGRLQVIILTCHPDRFDHLPGAKHIDLTKHISR
ncbi:MAG: ATP-binding protein, partial [Gemmataceae bacterium]